jgi:hypothetical protein
MIHSEIQCCFFVTRVQLLFSNFFYTWKSQCLPFFNNLKVSNYKTFICCRSYATYWFFLQMRKLIRKQNSFLEINKRFLLWLEMVGAVIVVINNRKSLRIVSDQNFKYCLLVSYSFIFDSFGASKQVYRKLWYIKSPLWTVFCKM